MVDAKLADGWLEGAVMMPSSDELSALRALHYALDNGSPQRTDPYLFNAAF